MHDFCSYLFRYILNSMKPSIIPLHVIATGDDVRHHASYHTQMKSKF